VSCKGVFTALVTPFDQEGRVDLNRFGMLLDRQMTAAVDGVVILGTTGEAPTLNSDEKEALVRMAVSKVKGSLALFVGTGSNSTHETIERSVLAERLGADGVMIVTPYYNMPSPEGIYAHVKEVARKISLPIMYYNTPGRSGRALTLPLFSSLLEIDQMVALKDCSSSFSFMSELLALIQKKRPSFSLLTGDDEALFTTMMLGGKGVVSVLSNLFPEKMRQLAIALERKQVEEARRLHFELLPYFKLAFIEGNPTSIKAMMNHQGLEVGGVRMPLQPISETGAFKIKESFL
jgi:4-hydroxy-tetrahydrodipicolinate synthase